MEERGSSVDLVVLLVRYADGGEVGGGDIDLYAGSFVFEVVQGARSSSSAI